MIEVVAGYKDTYHHVRNILSGIAVVRQVSPAGQGDKVLRASVLEAVFESGRVCIERAAWNDAWLRELAAFPNAAHDDQVDSLVVAVGNELQAKRKMGLSR
jgi:predicted phage terminase large subunit-like protein